MLLFSFIVSVILDVAVKREVEDLYAILKIIATATDQLQCSKCKIADVVCIVKNMNHKLQSTFERYDDIYQQSKLRFTKMLSKIHIAAYLLSPTHQFNIFNSTICCLTSEEVESGLNYIRSLCPSLTPKVLKFRAKMHPFNVKEYTAVPTIIDMSDYQWWIIFNDSYPNLFDEVERGFIYQLCTASASSAELERAFSKFGLVQSKLRNKLGNELALKLAFLYHRLNKEEM